MNNVVRTAAAFAALVSLGNAAFAQTSTQYPAPKKPGLLSRLFHPKPKPGIYQSNGSAMHPMGSFGTRPGMMGHSGMTGRPGMMGGAGMMGGSIIGNRNSHVYHMAGDRTALPAPQNRVYFRSAAAAQAAGYHAAGGGRAMGGSMMTHHTMMPGTMMHH